MYQNIEIEFKSKLSFEDYQKIFAKFYLEGNLFKQTNYYFDTTSLDLLHKNIILRIREKGYNYKITLKISEGVGSLESHVIIDAAIKEKYLKEGFNTSLYFPNYNYDVVFQTSLLNHRAITPYENGVIFLDKCEYNNLVDYEVEFEHDNYELGKRIFENFLKKLAIPYTKTNRKSRRAIESMSK